MKLPDDSFLPRLHEQIVRHTFPTLRKGERSFSDQEDQLCRSIDLQRARARLPAELQTIASWLANGYDEAGIIKLLVRSWGCSQVKAKRLIQDTLGQLKAYLDEGS